MVTEYQQMLDAKLRQMNQLKVNPEYLMPMSMLHNWRRRRMRLARAHMRALDAKDYARCRAIGQAERRLHTGRLHP